MKNDPAEPREVREAVKRVHHMSKGAAAHLRRLGGYLTAEIRVHDLDTILTALDTERQNTEKIRELLAEVDDTYTNDPLHEGVEVVCRLFKRAAEEAVTERQRAEYLKQQAQMQAQEMRTQSGIVREIGHIFGLRDYEGIPAAVRSLKQRADAAEESNHQKTIQLAGCSMAASGYGDHPKYKAEHGDYGWSVAFDDVRELYRKYDAAERDAAVLRMVESWAETVDIECPCGNIDPHAILRFIAEARKP